MQGWKNHTYSDFNLLNIYYSNFKEGRNLENFVINGGKELFGEVNISGAKNASVAIIPAAILADDKVRIENIPNISDVSLIIKILSQMGAQIKMISKDTIEIDTRTLNYQDVPYEFASHFRASYYLIGAMLGRFKKAEVALPAAVISETGRSISI